MVGQFFRLSLFVLFLFFLISCGSQQDNWLSPEEKQYLDSHKDQIVVLTGYEAPPNSFRNEKGENEGLLIDYLKEIEGLWGFSLTQKNFDTWSDLMVYAETASDFIIIGIAETDARRLFLIFSRPIISVPYVIVSRESSSYRTMSDLFDIPTVTVENYAVNDYLKDKYPGIPLFRVKDNLEGLMSVADNQYEAMVINQMYASWLVEKNGITNLRLAGNSVYLNILHAATSRNNPELATILDKTIMGISESKRQELFRKWVSLDNDNSLRIIALAFGVFITAAALFFFLAWIWVSSMRRMVKKRTNEYQTLAEDMHIILDSIADAVVTLDKNGNVVSMNPVAEKITGWMQNEAEGRPASLIVDIDFHKEAGIFGLLEELEKSEKKIFLESRLRLKPRRSDEVIVGVSGAFLRRPDGEHSGVVLVIRDITRIIEQEKKLIQSEKLDSIGVLAGGIAHDFNNMLTGLYGWIEIAQNSLSDSSPVNKALENALKSYEGSVRLTNQLLTFAKGGDPVKEKISLAPLVDEFARFSLHGSNTRLETSFPSGLRKVNADRGQLGQVISNLVINAKQAMPEGGIIKIKGKNRDSDGLFYVRVIVEDTGPGIPSDIADKIFEPYYTTKDTGSGLGLASCHSIIAHHGGTLFFESFSGEGTRFVIDLPAIPGGNDFDSPDPVEESVPEEKSCRILVLDDDHMVLEILDEMLRALGHETCCKTTGSGAIEAYSEALEQKKPFDLFITDLTLPGEAGGKTVALNVLEMNSEARILISSGYSNDPVMAEYKDYGFVGVLKKPYKFTELKKLIHKVI